MEGLRAVSWQEPRALIIVFGATGRLGLVLLPVLASGPWTVVAVARDRKPADRPQSVHWIQIDVTEVDLWERSLRVFCGMADIHEHVIIVDLLLDKTTVTAMRRSLATGAAYIARLRARLAQVPRSTSLILASTTAVLSPWLYQTPYGLAKRRQLQHYVSAGMSGCALILPRLVDRPQNDSAGATSSSHLSYATAAMRIMQAVAVEWVTPSRALVLLPPDRIRQVRRLRMASRPCRIRAVWQVVVLNLTSWTTSRDSPQAHRLASHGRLELTPWPLRQRIDHHLVPAGLVRRLARHLDVEAVRSRPTKART